MAAPLTTEQLQAAFQAFHWAGWTFEAAMADPVRSRIVKGRACAMRTRQMQATHPRTYSTAHRLNPATGEWRSQRVATGYSAHPQDPDLFN